MPYDKLIITFSLSFFFFCDFVYLYVFLNQVLYDIGAVSTKEPFKCVINQGIILGEVSLLLSNLHYSILGLSVQVFNVVSGRFNIWHAETQMGI